MKKYNYDYAVKVQVVRGKRVSRTESMFRVKLTQVIFSGKAIRFPAAGDVVSLWVNSSCACPKFHKGRDYLVMGHAHGAVSKLLVSPVTIVTGWKDAHVVQIDKWNSKSLSKTDKSKIKKSKIQTEKNKKRKKVASRNEPANKATKGKSSTNVKQAVVVSQGDNVKTTESSTPTNSSDFMNGYTHGGRYYTKELAKKYNQATLRAART
ncbi:hypothetical protein Btru_043076 [Bulinus truncatus]|nr:hypothetical protein Btru_043076 [Bulinus truncatus]